MPVHNHRLVLALTFVATLGGLLFGYDTAVISGAVSSLDAYFIAPMHLPETTASSYSGWTISSAIFGCAIGGALAGWLGNAFGRREGMLLSAVLFLIGSIGSAVPELGFGRVGEMGPAALWPFIAYRIIGGVGVGVASMLSPLYIAEIAPSAVRGRLVSLNQLAIVTGIVLVYFVNWAIAAQGDEVWLRSFGWRWMLASEAVPAGLFLALLLTVPDTPRSLVLRGRSADALHQLKRVMHESDAHGILTEIERTLAEKRAALLAFGWPVVIIGLTLSMLQQLVGINAVLYYAPLMFANMGSSTNSALLQTVIVGTANLVFTLLAIFTVDHWGRKPLLVAGAALMALAMLALGTLFNGGTFGLAALIAVLAYIAGFAFSWGPVTWVLLSEMYPNSIKGKAMGLAVTAQWLTNLLVSWSFKVLDGNSWLIGHFNHGFAYWLYGVMSLLAMVFVIRYVPETKGRTLESIEELWERGGSPAHAPGGP